MRDFRDAKAMAHTLRAVLATKGHKVTNSESLELIAQAFGVTDWNTLSAAIRSEGAGPRADPPRQLPTAGSDPFHESRPTSSAELSSTLHRALAYANQRKHEYATLEHLLLALTDDVDASAVMSSCKVDLGILKEHLANYIDNELRELANSDDGDAIPTAAFRRVIQRALIHIQWSGREEITGANVLVAIFAETESPAVRLLGEQDMTRQDAVNFIVHGIAKGGGDTAAYST